MNTSSNGFIRVSLFSDDEAVSKLRFFYFPLGRCCLSLGKGLGLEFILGVRWQVIQIQSSEQFITLSSSLVKQRVMQGWQKDRLQEEHRIRFDCGQSEHTAHISSFDSPSSIRLLDFLAFFLKFYI
jgi:hypothetical protein